MSVILTNKCMAHDVISSVLVFLFFALLLTFPSGYSVVSGLMLIVSIFFLFRGCTLEIKKHVYFLVALVSFPIIWLADAVLRGDLPSDIEKPLRFILSVIIFLYLVKYPPRIKALIFGVSVGALGAGIFAIYQNQYEGLSRSGGHMAVIEFGNISMLLALLSLCSIQWALRQGEYKLIWTIFLVAAFFMGLLGSFLSGTRGGWIGLPVILLLYVRFYSGIISAKYISISGLILAAFVFVAALLPQTGLLGRIESAIGDVVQYANGTVESSIGLRLEMWKAAVLMFLERPIVGWGEYGYFAQKSIYVQDGIVNSKVIGFDHPHNEFLNVISKRGILGGASLLALYLIPILVFKKGLASISDDMKLISFMGLVFVVACIDFGISNVFFNRISGITVFSIGLVVLYAILKGTVQSNRGAV